jgi:glycosyltransferase involved in cell wall biosynthesis
MNTPKVTVYITNYNYGHYIEKAINSVINQSFKDIEIFIIDDGSTDNSKEIIEKYTAHDNIEIIYQKNKGLIVTNNIALRLAQGDYIMRLDADDYLDENAIKLMVDTLDEDSELGLVFPNYFIVDENENIINLRLRIPSEENNVKDNPAHGACTLIRTKCLRSIGGYDESFTCQDGYFLWINFFSRFKTKNIETPLFYYRRHNSNLTNDSERILKTRSKIISKFVSENGNKIGNTLAIVPVRGPKYNVTSIALEKVNDSETVLDLKLKEILKSDYISKVVVTTPDIAVIEFLKSRSYDNVVVIQRDSKLARLNSGLVETVNHVLERIDESVFETFVTFSVRFPWLDVLYIDNAIKSMYLFDTDSVISVRPENNRYFRATENGLKPIINQDQFTKLEREDIYRYSGGMIVTKLDFYKKEYNFFGGKNGHVIIDEKASFELKKNSDLKLL